MFVVKFISYTPFIIMSVLDVYMLWNEVHHKSTIFPSHMTYGVWGRGVGMCVGVGGGGVVYMKNGKC